MGKNFVNIIVTSLALAITYANIIAGSFTDNINQPLSKANQSSSSEYYFESKANLCFVQRSQETIYSVIENLYSFSYKKIPNITSERIKIYEKKLICSSYKHISFSSNIQLSCSTKQLIYPFDYFW